MTISMIPLLFAVVGLVLWRWRRTASVAEVGKILFAWGALAFIYATTNDWVMRVLK
jgi:4-amino-4-deoxy-L-arabinose transferase-like glycosyltransferase